MSVRIGRQDALKACGAPGHQANATAIEQHRGDRAQAAQRDSRVDGPHDAGRRQATNRRRNGLICLSSFNAMPERDRGTTTPNANSDSHIIRLVVLPSVGMPLGGGP